jgi:hypothetical protein
MVQNFEEVIDKVDAFRKNKIGFNELKNSFEREEIVNVLDYIISELDEESRERDKFIYLLYLLQNHK